MTFGDALAIFVSLHSMDRHSAGDTITFEELMGGLIGCIAAAIEQCDASDRERITEAVHRALDDRLADPVGDRELLN